MSYRTVELSSLPTALRDLTDRVSAHADAAAASDDEEVATELFAVERALTSASRRLTRLTSSSERR
jgi:hypothetical protein